jgi:Sulfotransferase family
MVHHETDVVEPLLTRGVPKLQADADETPRGIREIKHVFVCGMPRSGTTIVAKEIARLANCTGFENTGVFMDEGQYLQDVYPTEWACGGAGRFGFAPDAHLTEDSTLLTPTNIARLRQSWETHWDRDKTIRVEKTPGNLLKTRFLQAAFPNAHFVVIKRHPVPVSLATQKWSLTPLHELFTHWLHCHKIFDDDKKKLNRLFELSYEDYVEKPIKCLEEIASFIGTDFYGSLNEQAADSFNKKYFDRWARMLQSSPFKAYYRRVTQGYERRFREHGYSLAPPETAFSPECKSVRGILTPLLFLGVDIFFFVWRAGRRLRIRVENAALVRPLILSLRRASH